MWLPCLLILFEMFVRLQFLVGSFVLLELIFVLECLTIENLVLLFFALFPFYFQSPFSATIASSWTKGAFANVISLKSGSVVQPEPSSRVPDSFSKWVSLDLIFPSFDANSFRRFLESCLICSFSFSVTSCQSEFVAIIYSIWKCL